MIDHRWPRRFHRIVVGAVVGAVVAATLSFAAAAQTADVFEVRGVAVDITAETATAARKQALADGERRAFARLMQRLTLRLDRDRLPRLDADAIAALIKDFSVAEEKTSAVRYLARLDYRFKRKNVRDLLIEYGLPFAETPSKSVLVLPVYESAGALLLWDDPNPWRKAWEKRPAEEGLVPLTLPLGDLTDIASIGVEQAVKGDKQRLDAFAARYGSADALVAHGVLRVDARSGRPELEVTLTRYGTALRELTIVKNFESVAGEPLEALLGRAAVQLGRDIEDNWKQDNVLHFGRVDVAAVTVPIRGLADWLKVRRRLSQVAVVRKTVLVLLSRDEARINIHYMGEPEQLILALEQSDLLLSGDGGNWVLNLLRRPAAGKS